MDNPEIVSELQTPKTVLDPNPEAKETQVTPSVKLSKNKLRKLRNYEKRLASRLYRRTKEKEDKRSNTNSVKSQSPKRPARPHKSEKALANEKFREGQRQGPKVVIDCQYTGCMTLKEQKRLAQQLRRAYSSNRAAALPLHLHFTSLRTDSEFHAICVRLNEGFESYSVERSHQSLLDLFSSQTHQLVYLSPDSKNTLEHFDPSKIYVIGGLVDETTNKNISRKFTHEKSLNSAKLPIHKYFTRGDQGTFKTVLTVNQVFDIILTWYQTKDWVTALKAGLPQRSGFVPIEPRQAL